MRLTLIALAAALATGCCSTPPAPVAAAIAGNLDSLKLIEAQLLPLVPNGLAIDFGQVGGDGPEQLYRPQDGWRILLRTHQVRAASLVAWANGETFDQAAAMQALVIPAIEQAKRNLSDE